MNLDGSLSRRDFVKVAGELGRPHSGKVLFLETMGFADPETMSGEPMTCQSEVVESYEGRLRPRHEVLARLAKEGLCPILLTTNYDLLLEGAGLFLGRLQHRADFLVSILRFGVHHLDIVSVLRSRRDGDQPSQKFLVDLSASIGPEPFQPVDIGVQPQDLGGEGADLITNEWR